MPSYFKSGEWNFICDLCGRTGKSSEAAKTWDNHYVCARHKEVRNPQDFLRGVIDNPSVPWTRTSPVDNFVPPSCTVEGVVAGPGYGMPGCMIPGWTNPIFPLTPALFGRSTAIPNYAIPSAAIPNTV